ncbi:MAG: hypothetical protein AB2L11_03205 [Syntrophobacteraceae bacterium]
MSCRNLAAIRVFTVLCVFVLIATASAYDGPAGVTFRAPFIQSLAGTDAVVIEGLSVREKVRIDDNWSIETDGKGRAFPGGFRATVADAEIGFGLHNKGKKRVAANILIPFDASDKEGTGFTKPLSITIFLNGKPIQISRGPEFPREMMRVRSFLAPVKIPAGSTVMVLVKASHRLAVNPAWCRFLCTDAYVRFPKYRNLAAAGCSLEFEFDVPDERLKKEPLELRWKKTSQEEPVAEQKHETIRFKGESIEWLSINR